MCARHRSPSARVLRVLEAEAAVRTLLSYVGDNPDREGLVETPKRFVNAYERLFAGYKECPVEILDRTFSETGGYDEPVLVRDIPFYSHCEHHVMPSPPAARTLPMCRPDVSSACPRSRG